MPSVRAASDHGWDMVGRTSLPLLGAMPVVVHPLDTLVNEKKSGDTNGEAVNAFGGSSFAVSPAGAKGAPPSQPRGGGGYGY